MNRRSFFAAMMAAPAAAALPQMPAAQPVAIRPVLGTIPGKSITARELIKRAFITIGVLAPGQCPSSSETEYALGVLNEMVAREGWGVLALNSRISLLHCLELREDLALALMPMLPRYGSKPRRYEVSDIGTCVCGSALMGHGHAWEGTLYFTCTARECPQFDLPLRPPRIGVEIADPEVVQRVRAEEEAEARRAEEKRAYLERHDSEYQFYSGDRWPKRSR